MVDTAGGEEGEHGGCQQENHKDVLLEAEEGPEGRIQFQHVFVEHGDGGRFGGYEKPQIANRTMSRSMLRYFLSKMCLQ